jgi:glycine cleavage system pyridoxal-binding protein P
VQIGRSFCPTGAPVAHATVRVGSIALNDQQKPVVGQARLIRHIVVPTCADHAHSTTTLEFRVAPPVAVTVHVDPTIRPADYAVGGDTRRLGAQLGFGFSP